MIKRQQWKADQPFWDARKLVFIDETGVNTKMARRYGRSTVGQRCLSAEPHGHWQSSTFLAALRHDQITAPFFVEGAVDAEVFTAYLQHVLCPQLQPRDVVILDNLATHKIAAVETLINACGASVRYLPAYSPDLNPIEQAFAKLKRICVRRRPAPWTISIKPWPKPCRVLARITAVTSFGMPIIRQTNWKTL